MFVSDWATRWHLPIFFDCGKYFLENFIFRIFGTPVLYPGCPHYSLPLGVFCEDDYQLLFFFWWKIAVFEYICHWDLAKFDFFGAKLGFFGLFSRNSHFSSLPLEGFCEDDHQLLLRFWWKITVFGYNCHRVLTKFDFSTTRATPKSPL